MIPTLSALATMPWAAFESSTMASSRCTTSRSLGARASPALSIGRRQGSLGLSRPTPGNMIGLPNRR